MKRITSQKQNVLLKLKHMRRLKDFKDIQVHHSGDRGRWVSVWSKQPGLHNGFPDQQNLHIKSCQLKKKKNKQR